MCFLFAGYRFSRYAFFFIGIGILSAVTQATVKSILNGESQNPGTVTIKKLCDGFEITLGEFFSTTEFDSLEQEIR